MLQAKPLLGAEKQCNKMKKEKCLEKYEHVFEKMGI